MASINERFMDFQIAQQIKWIRLQNRDVKEALRILRSTEEQIADRLLRTDLTNYNQARLGALRQQLTEMIDSLGARLTPVLTNNMSNAAGLSAEVEVEAFKRILPAGLDVTTPNPGVVQTAAVASPFNGGVVDDWAKTYFRSLNETTWRTVLDGVTAGQTNQELVRTLRGSASQRYLDGALQARRRGLEALVRTSVNHATNQGRQTVWAANSDILKGVRWVSTLDTRTSPICRHRDGRVGPVVDSTDWTPPSGAARLDPPFARPPAHPNCRSTTVGVTKSWRELGFDVKDLPPGTRASMNGQVPGDTTYYDWLGRQSAAAQKDVLGKTRYDLWKKAGVKPTRFVNDAGQQLTLKELRRKMPDAFKQLDDGVPSVRKIKDMFDTSSFEAAQRDVGDFFTDPKNFQSLDPSDFGMKSWPTTEELSRLKKGDLYNLSSNLKMVVINQVEGGKPARYITNVRKKFARLGVGDPGDIAPPKPRAPRRVPDVKPPTDKNVYVPKAPDKTFEFAAKTREGGALGESRASKAVTYASRNLPAWLKGQLKDVPIFVESARSHYNHNFGYVRLNSAPEAGASTVTHELFHALDFKLRRKSNGSLRGTLDWNTADTKLNSLARSAREEFIRRDSKGKGRFSNGDGDFALGNWQDSYEGRLYSFDDGVSSEYIAVASQRYFRSLTHPEGYKDLRAMRELQPEMLNLLEYIWGL